ncbi:prolyl oligopeptidase family serine peptidase [Aquimarina mytili]|uniref:Prolyl oligopeptidase family serine peptidase n=1 Tax=Aquimarina mytili TaxID=874423 RepID=A0A936ZVA7_9FLAO|nr:prolyl oligopeptidase family serine peptidase [Aquimarina mytili]MBL0685338.1 prolyl oligopeptidase family serine peptidase [Aquimarina mytili]
MNKLFYILLLLVLSSCELTSQNVPVDVYFGHKIEDPHRYLEYVERDSSILDWVKKQNTETNLLLNSIPNRQNLIDKQAIYDNKRNYVTSKLQITNNDQIFYLKRNANENVSRLYYRNSIKGKETELFDPKKYQPESKSEYQINYIKPSWDGSKIVISINKDEDEYSQMIILDVKTKTIVSGVINNCKPTGGGGIQWLPDNNSISYVHFSFANQNAKNTIPNKKAVIYRLGTDPKDFIEVLSKENNPEVNIKPEDFPILEIDNVNNKYVSGIIGGATPYFDSYYISLEQLYNTERNWKPLFKKEHEIKMYLINQDSITYLTAKNSPNFKICKTSIMSSDFDNPEVLIKEKKGEIIKNFVETKNGLIYSTVIDGVQAKLYRLYKGEHSEIELPKPSADIALSTKRNGVVVAIKGWLSKTTRYLFNFETNTLDEYNLFTDSFKDPFDDLMIEEVTVASHDGEEVPLSLVYKKGIKFDGSTPVLMRGYGAYGASMVPNSYYPFLLYAREGGIYAVAHVRGGGEKGDAWHKGGFKTTKSNSWKDFIACTEYLIDKKYTSKGKVAAWSGSAGGIMIGRAMTERPDLYSAVIIDRGILNTIRLENGVNGANSAKEFGSVKDSIEFKGLLTMDAYHHIKDNTNYPATLITTGMNDTRVPPWQSMKFATRLQKANSSNNPILLKTEFDSGHGLQFTKDKEFETMATALSFALWQTGHPDYQPK